MLIVGNANDKIMLLLSNANAEKSNDRQCISIKIDVFFEMTRWMETVEAVETNQKNG